MHTIEQSIRSKRQSGSPAVIPYLTCGFPTREALRSQIEQLAPLSAVIELGVAFSDPMADGVTIQRSSAVALQQQASLDWLLTELKGIRSACPLAIMSYLNPLLTISAGTLGLRLKDANIAGLIIPDLPLEESAPLREEMASLGIALIQMVTPATPMERAKMIASRSGGFLYAVTSMGVTGGSAGAASSSGGASGQSLDAVGSYLAGLRAISPVPVAAGFGIRTREQVRSLQPHADALIVGSALIEAIEKGQSPGEFIRGLIG
ncbi:MAG: tryptophan synthase subunit alpha [Phycisphaerales bacterium]|nr:tryptophan synthase subunit alpha [Phycisphaerales bacterium]